MPETVKGPGKIVTGEAKMTSSFYCRLFDSGFLIKDIKKGFDYSKPFLYMRKKKIV